MKKTNFLLALILFSSNFLLAQTWDILDKSMATYNQNDGVTTNQAWAVAQGGSAGSVMTQQTGSVNITKTNAGSSNTWVWVRPAKALADLTEGKAYSIEVKARVKPIGIADEGSYFEANQIVLKLGAKHIATPIYLRYGDGVTGGSVSTTSDGSNPYTLNTSGWQVYRLIFHADHLKYDVYVAGVEEPVFENVGITSNSDQNGIYFGAASPHRCNMDVEYVKMGTGDFFSKPKIVSVLLSSKSQAEENARTVTATINTTAIDDNAKLFISLVDAEDRTIVDAIEAVVLTDKAVGNITVPEGLLKGKYFIKVTVPDGKIGEIDVNPNTAEYLITSSAFEGKNLVTFGNSITSAANSWAYQTHEKLRFNSLYNGAIAGACWYKRARKAQDSDSIWTQNYTDPDFAGATNETNSSPEAFQRVINNCAIVHIQKYLVARTTSPDYIILSYGTNDSYSEGTMGDVDAVLGELDVRKVNLYTMVGALRWCLDTLKTEFPQAKIYVALPIQAKDDSKNNGNIQKISRIKRICDFMSVPYFDCYTQSGITHENEATYLRDGVHPNAAGQDLHAAYISKKLEETVPTTDTQEIISKECISISANVLSANQNLSVMSAANELPISNIVVYSITGNEVYRKSISSYKYTFQASVTSGMYMLSVSLKDKTTKTFKFLVK